MKEKKTESNLYDFDKNQSNFWRSAKVGDIINIRDAQSFSEAGTGGLDYTIGDIRGFDFKDRGENIVASYGFFELTGQKNPLYLVLAETDSGFDLRICFIPSGTASGTRDDFIDAGQTWLFLPPENPDDFISSKLEYATYPDVPPIEQSGANKKFIFAPSGFKKPIYGNAIDNNAAVILIEYEAEPDEAGDLPDNPLLIVIEEAWILEDKTVPESGGNLTLMLGTRIAKANIDLIKH